MYIYIEREMYPKPVNILYLDNIPQTELALWGSGAWIRLVPRVGIACS